LASHGRPATGANGLAHGFIEQRGDDAAMDITGRALKSIRHRLKADNGAIFGEQKFELQSGGIGWSAAKTAILGCVRQWR
jgi:hypothetical protein